ncbi:hypothetical protein Taro_010869 [Colocasia esculenta]|uniref:Uncharacterized protein n=1 Tax=Colocasia esculenta TaxID=4460 RepID=A0A843U8N9_COLES|nr:hypothetical protein [Colocasia esculenta]
MTYVEAMLFDGGTNTLSGTSSNELSAYAWRRHYAQKKTPHVLGIKSLASFGVLSSAFGFSCASSVRRHHRLSYDS